MSGQKLWEFVPAPAPRVGQRMEVRGVLCIIRRILPAGTVEVESLSGGQWFRVSGLPFVKPDRSMLKALANFQEGGR